MEVLTMSTASVPAMVAFLDVLLPATKLLAYEIFLLQLYLTVRISIVLFV